MKISQATIKAFWDEQAEAYRAKSVATNPDVLGTELEIKSLARYLRPKAEILDLGCGNGYTTLRLAKILPAVFTGMDFSEKMIGQAEAALRRASPSVRSRVSFAVGDALHLAMQERFDQTVSCRCLINLPDFARQRQALRNIHRALKPGGTYVMCENTLEGLKKINALRRLAGLPVIRRRWHNRYFSEKPLLAFAKRYFRLLAVDNFESLYFIASRVFNARLTPKNRPPNYLSPINRLAAKLPSVGDCSPTKIFIFKKK